MTGMPGKVRVGIAGATGYAGQELVRLVSRHPWARLTAAMSSGSSEHAPSVNGLRRLWDGVVVPFDVETLARDCDVAMLALPDKAVPGVARDLLDAGVRVIDLSGAFRLRDPQQRAQWYGEGPWQTGDAVYGLTERYRSQLRGANLIACPGCYPTAALLALGPLMSAGLIDGCVVIDAKSGISGAGKTPSERTHFSEIHGTVAAYNVFNHRHTAEIEQELGASVTFVPHLVPINRGILETIYCQLKPDMGGAPAVRAALEDAYGRAPFVRLLEDGGLPEIKDVAHTNFCDIGWRVDASGRRLVMVACLDNLVKGAAGQAVQNLNISCGFDECAGLLH
jgi:N-acetyl-gamma-glutamyl-phosphate reductase